MEEQSAKRWSSTRRLSMGIFMGLLVALVAVVSPGCFSHFGFPWKAKAETSEKTESDKTKAEPAREDAKGTSPEPAAAISGTAGETPAKEAVPPGESPQQTPPRPSPPNPVPPDQGELASVDPDVRKAALEKAAGLSAVEYMKICHSADKDEWSVILYDNIGLFIDVKQYDWNKEKRKLERVLALKQIMHSKLEANLRKKEGGKTCEVFYRPRGGSSLFAWQPVDPSNARMMAKPVPRTEMAAVPAPVPPVSKPGARRDVSETAERSTRGRLKEKKEEISRRGTTRATRTPSHESAPAAIAGAPKTRSAKLTPRSSSESSRPQKPGERQSTKTALHFLQNWKAAWEDKDFPRFKSLYHPEFRADSLDFSQFLKKKNDFFHRYQYIRVEIDRIKVKKEGNHLEVSFVQNFRGDNYGDKGVKNMVLDVSKPKKVRILSETWSPL